MRQPDHARAISPLSAIGLVAILMLTAAANGPEVDLANPAVVGAILALVAVAVVALILVRRRRGGTVTRTTTTDDE